MTRVLPSSPNWYCNSVIDATNDGMIAYGARSDVNILLLTANCSTPSLPCNNQKAASSQPDDVTTEENPSAQDKDNGSSSKSQLDQKIFQQQTGIDYDDCVLLCTMSRLHRERLTSVRLRKHTELTDKAEQQIDYSMFTGSDDSKVRHYLISRCAADNTVKHRLIAEYELPKNVSWSPSPIILSN